MPELKTEVVKRIDAASAVKAAKPQIHLLTPEMKLAALPAMEFGARKYAPGAWLVMAANGEMTHNGLLNAAQRHLFAFQGGEDYDPESGLNHLHHAAACVGMLLTLISRGTSVDDR